MKSMHWIAASILCCTVLLPRIHAEGWTDLSTGHIAEMDKQTGQGFQQPFEKGCSGVLANRLTGEIFVDVSGFGIWKSADKGQTWTRTDGNVISGRCETGWAMQIDQDNPKRMAVFSLDGSPGYTTDGTTWKKFTNVGRNWDYGAVDWSSPDAKVIFAAKHEAHGETYKSIDGGTTWKKLSAIVNSTMGREGTMVGVIDANTFICSDITGVQRSTDQGATWTKVSDLQPKSKVAVNFKQACYVCTAKGLIVSKDKGATWAAYGSPVDASHGPFFGADENTIVVVGAGGVYKTLDGAKTWTKVSDTKSPVNKQYTFTTKWFGGYFWDPINDTVYATAMANPAFKNELAGKTK